MHASLKLKLASVLAQGGPSLWPANGMAMSMNSMLIMIGKAADGQEDLRLAHARAAKALKSSPGPIPVSDVQWMTLVQLIRWYDPKTRQDLGYGEELHAMLFNILVEGGMGPGKLWPDLREVLMDDLGADDWIGP